MVHFNYMEEMPTSEEILNSNIKELSTTIKKVNSYKFMFLRGIVMGVGTFVGATLVVTLVITILIQLSTFFGLENYFNSLFSQNL